MATIIEAASPATPWSEKPPSTPRISAAYTSTRSDSPTDHVEQLPGEEHQGHRDAGTERDHERRLALGKAQIGECVVLPERDDVLRAHVREKPDGSELEDAAPVRTRENREHRTRALLFRARRKALGFAQAPSSPGEQEQRDRAEEVDRPPAERARDGRNHHRANDRAEPGGCADDADHGAASRGGKLFRSDDHAGRPFADQEDAGDELEQRERPHVRRQAREHREQRVAEDRHAEHTPSAPAIGFSDEQVCEHRSEVHNPEQKAGRAVVEREVPAQIGQDHHEREKVVTLEKRRDAQKREEAFLVRGEGRERRVLRSRRRRAHSMRPLSGLDALA